MAKKLTPKQRVLERFPNAYLEKKEDGLDWPWVVFYKRPTRLTSGILGDGPTPQTAWDEAARVMDRQKTKRRIDSGKASP